MATRSRLSLRRVTQHDVKLCGKLANRRTHRCEIHNQSFAKLGGSRFQYEVHRIPRVAFYVALRREFIAAFDFDHEMNMRRLTARIHYRLDGAETVFAGRACFKTPESLE